MSEVKGLRVVVAGAGEVGYNASGVAAGMLAPVCEALLDPVSHDHLPFLRQAREAWDRMLPDLAASIVRSGAVIEAASPDLLDRAQTNDTNLEPIDADRARRLCPGLAPNG